VVRSAQVSCDGWIAVRSVDGLGRTPIPGQKQLMGKIIKTRHDRQYKKGLNCAQ